MKLAGDKLLFGAGCLEFLKTLPAWRVFVVTGGSSMKKSGVLDKVLNYLNEAKAQTLLFSGVESDPSFDTVLRGSAEMRQFNPDYILALGGGSPMDAAKLMWVYYEHPELKTLNDILTADPFPKLRIKARFICIPSTSGTASEVSRSVVITDGGIKHGIGNMEMMPDIAICDPLVTLSMPANITAETGMDAMTHALEALVSRRGNYISDILARQAVIDISDALPKAYKNGGDIAARETMLNASMIAGMAFTNVSLGIVHSMAHAIGGTFHISHGLADAVILPYVIEFNSTDAEAKTLYDTLAKIMGYSSMAEAVYSLNNQLNIPSALMRLIPDRDSYCAALDGIARLALHDGCTKTNPVIPTIDQLKDLCMLVYNGR
jgi:alcohol dehydrogenase class IV